ncbi:hypothetical protein PJF56_07395 [Roseofilum sp. BLCC_M91]|uniref:DUF2281 domain-containing protein n=1 Tax=Roseofilum halophilum BLCC-M91 TaxID=3022259 RepID=A0ABT7BHL4_9CYAN|nr:hypothetical protein [Roseofilum halophilum]MDJ1178682.1 hypothetical protein [Roseofilum halophilum BLCC-M91]
MSSNIEVVMQAIDRLSLQEREQVLSFLQDHYYSGDRVKGLENKNAQFWQGVSLSQLMENQQPKRFQDAQEWVATFWPEEDSMEDFLTFLKEQRKNASDS